MQNKTTKKAAKKAADTWFSRYIRLRDVDADGFGKCIDCGKRIHWEEGDAGHFSSRRHLSTRYDERNCHLQARGCNRFQGGRQYEHGRAIDELYGEGQADAIMRKSREIRQMTLKDFNETAHHFRKQALFIADAKGLICPDS